MSFFVINTCIFFIKEKDKQNIKTYKFEQFTCTCVYLYHSLWAGICQFESSCNVCAYYIYNMQFLHGKDIHMHYLQGEVMNHLLQSDE